jgi:heme-degrading monooxygenase HmoA
MIEAHWAWDLIPGVDERAYGEWAKKAIALVLGSPGIVEFRANRIIEGSPQVQTVSVFQTLADWGNFAENPEWQAHEAAGHRFMTNLRLELWGKSPLVPEPLRPAK